MTHILHVDSSARAEASHSRRVSQEFVDAYLAKHPGATVTNRDLGHQSMPHVTEEFITAMYTPAEHRTPQQTQILALSEELIGELEAADVYIFGVPMYNFGVPSSFKAYIDTIAVPNRTFDPATYSGLLTGKKMFVVTARGGSGYGEGEPRHDYNHQDGQIRAAFGLMGVTDVHFVNVENTHRGGDIQASSLTHAHEQIATLSSAA